MGKPGDKLTQTITLLQIGIGIALFLQGSRNWPSVRKGGLYLISLTVFLLASSAWSVSPGASLRAGVQYLSLIIAVIGMVENLEADDLMDLLARLCFLSAIASLVLLMVSPAIAIGEAGDFRGVFSQKNPLGEAMSMGALASLHGLRAGKGKRWVNILRLSVVTFTTIKSGSATSLTAILLFIFLGMALSAIYKRNSGSIIAVGAIIVVLPVALIIALNPESLLTLMGKDPTLTGRTDIWAFVIPDIFQRPLLGWGYAAFWTTDNPAAIQISDALRWWVPQAHNGLLEILLSVGFIGAAFYLLFLGRIFRLSVKCMKSRERATGITCFLSSAGVILVGVSENVVLYAGSITCIFFITALYCERAVFRSRERRPSHVTSPVASLRPRAGAYAPGRPGAGQFLTAPRPATGAPESLPGPRA
jgi:hypothetical protein